MSVEHDLAKSLKSLGQLVPTILDKKGEVVDGKHRKALNPAGPTFTVDLPDDKSKTLARMTIHNCRRTYSDEEWRDALAQLVGKDGMKVTEISEVTGIPETTIYYHMPKTLTDQKKVEAGQAGGVAKAATTLYQTVKTQDKKCEVSGCFGNGVKEWNGGERIGKHLLCERHSSEAASHPEVYLHRFGVESNGKKIIEKKPTEMKPRDFDSWTQRKAEMQPQHSEMETTIQTLLMEKGVTPVQTDRSFCLLSTTPDFVFPKHNLAVYLDFTETHQKREDRDEKLREMLTKRHGMRVVSIPYKSNSKQEAERILAEIVKEAS